MKNFLSLYSKACFDNKVWFVLKLVLAVYWLPEVWLIFLDVNSVSVPDGVCLFMNCETLKYNYIRTPLLIASTILALMYVMEVKMKTVLLLSFLISVVVFSYSDSSGVLHRWQGFSMCYFAQLVGYVGKGTKLFKRPLCELRITFSQQVVAAMYTLAGISKLKAEGVQWFLNYEGLAVQTSKSWLYAYVTTGDVRLKEKAEWLFNLIIEHPYVTCSMLLIALMLETFSVLSLISRPLAFLWGCGLFAMHVGISYGMDILIIAIALPMTLYFINPPAIILALYQVTKGR